MLNKEQLREYNRASRTKEFFDGNQTTTDSYEPFKNEVTDFTTNFQTFTNLIPDKDIVSKGITAGKTELKRSFAKTQSAINAKTHAYALKINNAELAAETTAVESTIFRMPDASILGYATSIIKTITPLINNQAFVPYGVTAANLAEVAQIATQFNNLIGDAKQDSSGIGVANAAIDKQIELLRGNYKQFDLLIVHFEDDNPDFVQGYEMNSRLGDTNVRHTGIEGTVTDKNGAAIINATIKLLGTTKSAGTDLYGKYKLDHVLTDDYQVECSAPGFAAKTVVFHIQRGRIDELNFVLDAL